jgi:hypothetical protein
MGADVVKQLLPIGPPAACLPALLHLGSEGVPSSPLALDAPHPSTWPHRLHHRQHPIARIASNRATVKTHLGNLASSAPPPASRQGIPARSQHARHEHTLGRRIRQGARFRIGPNRFSVPHHNGAPRAPRPGQGCVCARVVCVPSVYARVVCVPGCVYASAWQCQSVYASSGVSRLISLLYLSSIKFQNRDSVTLLRSDAKLVKGLESVATWKRVGVPGR